MPDTAEKKAPKLGVRKRWWLLSAALVIMLLPLDWQQPVVGATSNDWHPESFWFAPWGDSVTHKGIDIFGQQGQGVVAAHNGIRLYQGELKKGGKVVLILGPEFKLSYYAHLDSINQDLGVFIRSGDAVGTLGKSGNAKDKPAHLHFSVISMLPYIWRWDLSQQGWKKMFYMDPNAYLKTAS